MFWTSDLAQTVRLLAGSAGLELGSAGVDVWSGADVPLVDVELVVEIPAHGVRLLRFPA